MDCDEDAVQVILELRIWGRRGGGVCVKWSDDVIGIGRCLSAVLGTRGHVVLVPGE